MIHIVIHSAPSLTLWFAEARDDQIEFLCSYSSEKQRGYGPLG